MLYNKCDSHCECEISGEKDLSSQVFGWNLGEGGEKVGAALKPIQKDSFHWKGSSFLDFPIH